MSTDLTAVRNVYFRKEENFIYTNTSLLRSLKIVRPKECSKLHLIINGTIIPPTDHTLTTLIWNMAEVRGRFSNEYENNDWIRMDQTLGMRALDAMNYYSKVPSTEFSNTIFTKDLRIWFQPAEDSVGARKLKLIEGTEDVFTSDAMLEKTEVL